MSGMKIVDGSGVPFDERKPEAPPDPARWWERFAAAKKGWNDAMKIASMPATRIQRVGDFDEPVKALLAHFRASGGAQLDLPMDLDKVPADAIPGITTVVLITLLSDAWNGVMMYRGFPPSRESVSAIDQQLGVVTRIAWILATADAGEPIDPPASPVA